MLLCEVVENFTVQTNQEFGTKNGKVNTFLHSCATSYLDHYLIMVFC